MTYVKTDTIARIVRPTYKATAFANRVADMLTYKRPHESASEAAFIDRFIKPVLDSNPSWTDAYGNMYVDLRTNPKHRTMFTSHVDSVHRTVGRQKVKNTAGVLTTVDGECLGADDAAGMALLLHMIEHKVPALYVFTRNEEHGGVGASHIVTNHADLLEQFDRAVAFDRRADWSVITHQGGRCCSDAFAEALSEALSTDELMYAPDDTGVYTDTAEFTDIIAECCNVSTFYLNEHTKHESLDVVGLERLAAQVLTVAWDDLPVVRKPGDSDWPTWDKWDAGAVSSAVSGDSGWLPDDDWFEQELEEALAAAYEGDPDELVYLAAQEYACDTGSSVLTVYRHMIKRHIDMSMINEVDRDLSMFSISEALLRLADKLMSTH